MNWSKVECKLIVKDYFAMYTKELRGESYNKAEHRRKILPLLEGRSVSSVEYKHQNISAILIHLGRAYIKGYKPAWNYQELLAKTVMERLQQQLMNITDLEQQLIDTLPVGVLEPDLEAEESAPVLDPKAGSRHDIVRDFALKIDFATQEAKNRELGERGEQYVLLLEKKRLKVAGQEDLVKDVVWVSKDWGDGAGYDIRSFNAQQQELFIEVKTTNADKYQPFYITENEVVFSEEHASNYALCRLFQFAESPRYFQLQGNVRSKVQLTPVSYRAGFFNDHLR